MVDPADEVAARDRKQHPTGNRRGLPEDGATLLNYAPVTGVIKGDDGFVAGVEAIDVEGGSKFTAPAKVVINATGPFSDSVRRLADPTITPMISPSQGIHLVFDQSFLPRRQRHHGAAHQ